MDDYLDLMKRFKARRNMNAKGYGSGWTVPKEYREELVDYFGLSEAKPKYQPAPKTKYETKLQKRKGDESEEEEDNEDSSDNEEQPSYEKSPPRRRSPSPKRSSRRSRSHEDEDEIEELTQKMKELSSRLDKLKRK